jgi:hypothetical protein
MSRGKEKGTNWCGESHLHDAPLTCRNETKKLLKIGKQKLAE